MSVTVVEFKKAERKASIPDIHAGDIIVVSQKIKEGDKERIQQFEGLVLAKKHGDGINATITVRKVSNGIGVERVFPIHSPTIEKIKILRHSDVRRSKLYFIRTKAAKEIRRKMGQVAPLIAEAEIKKEE
mgnify:CR=1 FL=1